MSEIMYESEYPLDEGQDIEETMTDMDADDCLRKIDRIEKYRKRFIDFYQKKIDEINVSCDSKVAYQKRKLRNFFKSVLHRKTKTFEAYDLPSGRVSLSFATTKLVPNKDAMLKRFIENGERDFVKSKVVEEVDWNGYKACLSVNDNGEVIDTTTGEIISDVDVKIVEPEFKVTLSKELTNEGEE